MLTALAGIRTKPDLAIRAIQSGPFQAFGRTLFRLPSSPVKNLHNLAARESDTSLKEHGITAVQYARSQIIASSNLGQIQAHKAPAETERLTFPGIESNMFRRAGMEDWELMKKRGTFVNKQIRRLQEQYECAPWVPAVLFSDQYPVMKDWLPQFFQLDEVYSVIRLEQPLKEGEQSAVTVNSISDLSRAG